MKLAHVFALVLFVVGFLFTMVTAALARAALGVPWGIALILGAMVGGFVVIRTWVVMRA